MAMSKNNTTRIMTKSAFAASETKLFIPTFSVSAGREGSEGPGRSGRRDGEKVAMTNTMLSAAVRPEQQSRTHNAHTK